MIELRRYDWEYSVNNAYYRPVGDSIPVQTWRGEDVVEKRKLHKYPIRGCHGGPLEKPEIPDRTDIP